jgi:hypothetical protein
VELGIRWNIGKGCNVWEKQTEPTQSTLPTCRHLGKAASVGRQGKARQGGRYCTIYRQSVSNMARDLWSKTCFF